MKKLLIFVLVLSLTLSLCSCFTKTEQSGGVESPDVSDVENDTGKGAYVKIPADKITITTESEHLFFDSTMTFRITVDSDNEFSYGNEYYVEYYENGSWKRSEKEFSFTEEAYIATFEAKLSFTLSDRADPGKEKYRIVMNISAGGETHTVYSNEFTAE